MPPWPARSSPPRRRTVVQVATKAVDRGAGVLHIVKNYTGDVLNFEMAAELASMEGIEVGSITVDDDVAVQDSLYTAGRRGVGLTVLLEKIVVPPRKRAATSPAVVELAKKVNGQGSLDGHGAHQLHGSRRGQAHLRPPRRPDGDRHRHPR